MNLLRAMLPDGPLSTAMKTQIKEELLKGLYPNFIGLLFAYLLARQHARDHSLPCAEFETI